MSRSSTVEHTTDNRVMEVRFFPRQPCQQDKCPTDSHKVGLVGALPTAGTKCADGRVVNCTGLQNLKVAGSNPARRSIFGPFV